MSIKPDDGHRRRAILQTCATMFAASLAWATGSRAAQPASEQHVKWIAFYGQIANEQALASLASYDIVVLDPMFAGSIATVAADHARVCGYLRSGSRTVFTTR